MAAKIKFDVTRRAQVRNSLSGGLVINRQCMVYDIPIDPGDSDPSVLLKCIALSNFPKLKDPHPDPSIPALVDEQNLRGIDRHISTVDCDIIYKSPPIFDGGGGIFFQVTQSTQTSTVDWYSTANLSENIQIWYKNGTAAGITTPPDDADFRNTKVNKIICHEVLKATGIATAQQWIDVKDDIRAARNMIHSDNWGGYPRGRWLFLGANTRNLDSAYTTLQVELNFIEHPKFWFPVAVWPGAFGNLFDDMSPEASLSLPVVDTVSQANGIVKASVYDETEFTPLFGFTPQ